MLWIQARWVRSNLDLFLTLCLASGLALALLVSVPAYADAVDYQLLQRLLASEALIRPPVALTFRHDGRDEGTTPEAYQDLDRFVRTRVPEAIGLPLKQRSSYVVSYGYNVFKPGDALDTAASRGQLWVGFYTGIADHILLADGRLPQPVTDPKSPAEAIVHRDMADQLGLVVGETYILVDPRAAQQSVGEATIPVTIVGTWFPADERDSFWVVSPGTLKDVLLVPEETLFQSIGARSPRPIHFATWQVVFDERALRPEGVSALQGRIAGAQTVVEARAPGMTLGSSPSKALEEYQLASAPPMLLVYFSGIPVVCLVLYFVVLVSRLAAERRRSEMAVLRSRGLSRGQEVAIGWLGGGLVAGLALLAGLALGPRLAQVIGLTRSFLELAAARPLPVRLTPTSLLVGLAGAGVIVLAVAGPAVVSARPGIVGYKQEIARRLRRPAWRRHYLELLLFLPAGYGVFSLVTGGNLALPRTGLSGNDPFRNPLLFLVPDLLIFAAALTFVRAFPFLLGLLVRLGEPVLPAGLSLGLRGLARSTASRAGSQLLLLSLTLALAGFTAALARTLDNQLVERSYYRVGADLSIVDLGEAGREESPSGDQGAVVDEQPQGSGAGGFLSGSDLLAIPGVRAATRVGVYDAELPVALGGHASLIAVDRLEFPAVAFYRRDFAREPLGALMNVLGAHPSHVLASRQFIARTGFRFGEELNLLLSVQNSIVAVPVVVAGQVDLFPGVYPEATPDFFVGNLDYLYDTVGGVLPHQLWFRVDQQTRLVDVWNGAKELGVVPGVTDDARERIRQEETRFERQGTLGLLSMGFAAAVVLAIVGFLASLLASLERQTIELGVLRGIGLSRAQALLYTVAEPAAVLSVGMLVGSALGLGVGRLFIPYLQSGDDVYSRTPPFVVRMPWGDLLLAYGACALILASTLVIVMVSLSRLRLFEAIKMGEESVG